MGFLENTHFNDSLYSGGVFSLLVTWRFFYLLKVESPNALITQFRAKEFEEWIFLKCRIKGG